MPLGGVDVGVRGARGVLTSYGLDLYLFNPERASGIPPESSPVSSRVSKPWLSPRARRFRVGLRIFLALASAFSGPLPPCMWTSLLEIFQLL